MRSNQRNTNIHTLLFIILCIALAVLASAATFMRSHAATPTSGSIAPTLGATIGWAGDPTLATGATGGESQCIDNGPGKKCHSFAVTGAGDTSDWEGKLLQVKVDWNLGTHHHDLHNQKEDHNRQTA